MLDIEKARAALHAARLLIETNHDHLIEIDSVVGDGDLGLTMSKAFRTADDELTNFSDPDVGAFFARAGAIMAKAAPSTMGTLMATGFMRGGKAVKGQEEIDAHGIALFFRSFSDGVMERGKTQPGNKTIVDVMDPVATALEEAAASGVSDSSVAMAAVNAAARGEEAARDMMSQHGKAAIYREQTVGKPDPGATAGAIFVRGFFSVFPKDSI